MSALAIEVYVVCAGAWKRDGMSSQAQTAEPVVVARRTGDGGSEVVAA